MIKSKKELKEYLKFERQLYIDGGKIAEIKMKLIHDSDYLIWHYIKMLRFTEYYYNKDNKILYWLYERKKNMEGSKLGISIFQNSVGKGLKIYHYGNIVINSNAKVGENIKLHGDNCIGNKGEQDKHNAPIVEKNVELGFGAQIIGDIHIGSETIIASNAVVVKNSLEKGIVLAGIPAKKIKKIGE